MMQQNDDDDDNVDFLAKKVLLQLWPQNFADSFPSFSSSLLLLSLNLRNKILKYFLSSSFKKICAQVNDDE